MARILLGVCSSVAIHKACELVRELKHKNHQVKVVLTPTAERFITRLTFSSLSGNKAYSDWEEEDPFLHITLPRWCDLFLIAPCSVNTLSKIANGIADNLLTNCVLAHKGLLMLAPACNVEMWQNPAVQENVERLKKRGVVIIEPEEGRLACEEEGKGRLASLERILDWVEWGIRPKPLQGKRVLLTVGATREFIDDVRFISNLSTGRTGFAIARVLRWYGADVQIIAGYTEEKPPPEIPLIRVSSAEEMLRAVLENVKFADLLVMNSAVADYRPSEKVEGKLKKGKEVLEIRLVKNPDILEEVSKLGLEGLKVVEIDPYDPTRPPVKRTALGRFKHEAATTAVANDGRVVVYMGDDERFNYIYKLVTKGKYDPLNRTANFGLLDEGTLYVAKFNDDLTGEWIPIATVDGNRITPNPNLPEPFQSDPVLCFIYTRKAADMLGATKMDRPEDFEWNPITKSVFAVLTYNDRRGASGQPGTDKANPRPLNYMGHIIEIKEQNNDPASTKFTWVIAILCGDPRATEENRKLYIYGQPAKETTPAISAPDNIAFDKLGNVWIATDGNPSKNRLAKNDGVYTLNVYTKELKMFLSGVPGCEICGPEFSEDYKTFFCAIQHPGEHGANTKWPYLNDGVVVPRPSVIQVQRNDGKEVYL